MVYIILARERGGIFGERGRRRERGNNDERILYIHRWCPSFDVLD
jgi:hypothetical protein